MRKVKTILTFEMLRENEVRSLRLNFLYFLTEVEGNLQATDEEAINIYKETLREKLQNFNKNKRIWRFEKVISLDIHFSVWSTERFILHWTPKIFSKEEGNCKHKKWRWWLLQVVHHKSSWQFTLSLNHSQNWLTSGSWGVRRASPINIRGINHMMSIITLSASLIIYINKILSFT